MWIWILSAILLVLIWGGGFLLAVFGVPVPLWTQVLATVLVVLLVVGVLVLRRVRAQLRARALEREILKQSEAQAANTRPDRRAEIAALQRQIEQGIASLKQSKIGKKYGRGALYVLPWYAIIGPPGAGKTTALRHSGLQFPFLDPSGGAVKGVGGTRNCDWWFTSEGILLDTAGRYATQQDDREEWLAFLGLLRRFRPEKPINGLIVAVAVSDLMQSSEEQISTYATTLRARVDEIMTRLDMVLPVYLVFTKTDLVAGFAEFFNDLRKSERDQVLGATLGLAEAQSADPGALFGQEFDSLVHTLHARAIRQIQRERHPENRQRIFQFPLEFRALGPSLEEFVRTLFQRNSFQENPLFRGFYFTSGTQEGRPIDRVIAGMARAFGLRHVEAERPATEPRSYFVTDLFRQVVFPDQDLAGRTAGEIRRQKLVRLGIAAGALGLAALIAIPTTISFFKNRELIESTAQVARSTRTVNWNDASALAPKAQSLDAARARLEQLRTWRDDGAPLSMRWGLYSGNTLYSGLRDAYVAALNPPLGGQSKNYLESKLRALAAQDGVAVSQFASGYDTLKLYLMLGTIDRLDPKWATPRLAQTWANAAQSPDPATVAALTPHVALYIDLMKRGEIPPWQLDMPMVTRVRTVLLRSPQLERMYELLVTEANAEIAPIKRETIFYGDVAPHVTSKRGLQVDGAYTQQGWRKVKQLLGSQRNRLVAEQWVLGEDPKLAEENVQRQLSKLRDLYFARFQKAWQDFLVDMEVRQPETSTIALEELTALSEPEWPYQRLLRTLQENVTLDVSEGDDDKDSSLTERAKAEIKKRLFDAGAPAAQRVLSPVETAFKPLLAFAGSADDKTPSGLTQYQGLLSKLVGLLTDVRDSSGPPDTQALANEFQQAFRSANELLTSQNVVTRPLLGPYLLRPITGSWSGVLADSGAAKGGLWEVTVWEKYSAQLAPYYPFTQSPKDVKLDDFTEFFRPGDGLLWRFFDENLKGSLDRVGTQFIPKKRFQSAVNFAGDFTDNCLSKGAQITDATFPPKSDAPKIAFKINLHSVSPDVSEVELSIDGVSHVYKNTPEEWIQATWPAKDAESRGARVRVRGYSGLDESVIRDGDFGFFRMLDAADQIVPNGAGAGADRSGGFVAKWTLRSQQTFFKLDVVPQRMDNELSSAIFKDFRCPRVIATKEQ